MTISDLSYLADDEMTTVTGGSGFFNQNVYQNNSAYVSQYASSYSDAESFRGTAYSNANSSNYSGIGQSNFNVS